MITSKPLSINFCLAKYKSASCSMKSNASFTIKCKRSLQGAGQGVQNQQKAQYGLLHFRLVEGEDSVIKVTESLTLSFTQNSTAQLKLLPTTKQGPHFQDLLLDKQKIGLFRPSKYNRLKLKIVALSGEKTDRTRNLEN